MTVSVASRLAEVDDLTARHVSAYHSRSARISLRNAQYHVAKGNISLQRSASFNADRVGISLALRANITAQRAISRCQRQHITATLRIARVGVAGRICRTNSHPVNLFSAPLHINADKLPGTTSVFRTIYSITYFDTIPLSYESPQSLSQTLRVLPSGKSHFIITAPDPISLPSEPIICLT